MYKQLIACTFLASVDSVLVSPPVDGTVVGLQHWALMSQAYMSKSMCEHMYFFFQIFLYLVVPLLSCGIQDL